MTSPGFTVFLASVLVGAGTAAAADATTPVDYTQRNAPFAPSAGVTPDKKTPETNSAVQEKRVEKNVVAKPPAAVGERRAAVDVAETSPKNVREKESQRPAKVDQPTSAYDHRQAAISTADDTKKPPTVAKYQDSLTSASAANMARFPALDGATGAKLNRFVFRKNGTTPAVALDGAPVTPAAGAAVIRKD